MGYVFDDVARSSSVPPAPNPARAAIVVDFAKAAHRLANADEVCAATHNAPRPLPPTPIPNP